MDTGRKLNCPYQAQAENAARFESLGLYDMEQAEDLRSIHACLEGYSLLEVVEFDRREAGSQGDDRKALIILGPEGELYVHYRGTGDGNWEYNEAAYGKPPLPSPMQAWACDCFDNAMDKYGWEGPVYVTGHSQGGHNAQYVTLHARRARHITACVSLDGPGHAAASVLAARRQGSAYFQAQRNKLYAYNGCCDYVSCLGQEQLVPREHCFFVDTPPNPRLSGPRDVPMLRFHASGFLLDDSLSLRLRTRGEQLPVESQFRLFVKLLNDKVRTMEQEPLLIAVTAIMQLCENYIGKEDEPAKVTLEEETFEAAKPILIPPLLDLLEERPELMKAVLDILGCGMFSGALEEFCALKRRSREKILRYAAGLLQAKGEEVGLRRGGELKGSSALFPLLWEVLLHHPGDVVNILRLFRLDERLGRSLSAHKLLGSLLCLLLLPLLPLALVLCLLAIAADRVHHALHARSRG